MKPTEEQAAAIAAACQGLNVSITAGAGTGKTTTLKMIGQSLVERGQRGLYVAFNKQIQREAEKIFPSGVFCSTAHSLAYRAGGHRYRSRLDSKRLSTSDIVEFLGATAQVVYFEDKRDGAKEFGAGFIASMAMQTVIRFCQSADQDIEARHVPRIPGLDDEGEWAHNRQLHPVLVKLARKAWWDDLRHVQGTLRFEHDHYLKMFQLSESSDGLGYDFIFADEAQDLSPVMINVFQRQAANGAQVIAVGDSNQAIYSWRGAVDGMYMIEDAEPAELSWCWRFGEEIAVPVNAMLGQLEADLRLVGKGGPGQVRRCPDPSVILGRTNDGVCRAAMAALDSGRAIHIVGNLPRQIISFAEAARTLMAGRKTFHHELSWANSWSEVIHYVENDSLGADLLGMVQLVEFYGVDRIVELMRSMESSEASAEVVFSSMHASKGREWPEVRLLGDYPVDETGKPVLSEETMRLYYVAASRAQEALDISRCVDVFYPKPTTELTNEEGSRDE